MCFDPEPARGGISSRPRVLCLASNSHHGIQHLQAGAFHSIIIVTCVRRYCCTLLPPSPLGVPCLPVQAPCRPGAISRPQHAPFQDGFPTRWFSCFSKPNKHLDGKQNEQEQRKQEQRNQEQREPQKAETTRIPVEAGAQKPPSRLDFRIFKE